MIQIRVEDNATHRLN